MISRIFPSNLNNEFRGSIIGIVIFALINGVKFLMGFNISGLNPFVSAEHILKRVDAIPLDEMPHIAVSAIMGSSQAWAVLMLLIGLFGFLALFRYRAMIPLLFTLHLFDHSLRKYFAIAKSGFDFSKPMGMGDAINWALIGLIIIGLIFSCYGGKKLNQK